MANASIQFLLLQVGKSKVQTLSHVSTVAAFTCFLFHSIPGDPKVILQSRPGSPNPNVVCSVHTSLEETSSAIILLTAFFSFI